MILCVLCWRWLGFLFSVLDVFSPPLCAKATNTSAGDRLYASWPLTLPTATEGGGAYLPAVATVESYPPILNTQPWGWRTSLSSRVSLLTRHTEYRTEILRPTRRRQRTWNISADLHGQAGFARSGGCSSSPANLFVLYCTHQVPVSHKTPFPL